MLLLRAPCSAPAAPRRARPVTKASASGVNSLVRVHDRLLKLEARVDLALQREASSASAEDETASAVSAAAAASAAQTQAAAADAADAEVADERDLAWRVKDAVEAGFEAGWEARRGGSGAIRPVLATTAAPPPPAAAAAPPTPPPPTAPVQSKPASTASSSAAAAPAPATAQAPPTTATTTATVEFVVRCPQTSYGERVWLLGGPASLGKWSPERALRLRWAGDGRWAGAADIEVAASDAEKPHEFKALLRLDDDASCKGRRWEARDKNRQLLLVIGATGGLEARASERTVVTVPPEGEGSAAVRVEFDARF